MWLKLLPLLWVIGACTNDIAPPVPVDAGQKVAELQPTAPCGPLIQLDVISRSAAESSGLIDFGSIPLTDCGNALFAATSDSIAVREADVELQVPGDSVSFVIALPDSSLVPSTVSASALVTSLQLPNAVQLIGDTSTPNAYFTSAALPVLGSQQVTTVLHPKVPDRAPIGGVYRFRIASDVGVLAPQAPAYSAGLQLAVRRGDPAASTSIGLNVVYVRSVRDGNGQPTSTAARDSFDTLLRGIPQAVNAIFQGSGFRIDAARFGIGEIASADLAIVDATRSGISRLVNATVSQKAGADLTLQETDRSKALHLYIVSQIFDDMESMKPSPIDAFASAIPGALGFAPQVGSGVFISWDSIADVSSEQTATLLALVAAHETGHWLGLHHTTEPSGQQHDLLSDTPNCPLTQDIMPLDGRLTRDECTAFDSSYLMFWNAQVIDKPKLSPQQQQIVRWNPLARADSAGGT